MTPLYEKCYSFSASNMAWYGIISNQLLAQLIDQISSEMWSAQFSATRERNNYLLKQPKTLATFPVWGAERRTHNELINWRTLQNRQHNRPRRRQWQRQQQQRATTSNDSNNNMNDNDSEDCNERKILDIATLWRALVNGMLQHA